MRKIKFLNVAMIIIAALLISSFTLFNHKPESTLPPATIIKSSDFEKAWRVVDSLIKIGLPKSALEKTEQIYIEARETGNHPHFIKSVLYKMKLNADFQEDFLVKITNDLQTEINRSETPVKQILHSIQADIYWRYYQSNRRKFLDRTAIAGVASEDITTWDLSMLMHAIIVQYEASLENGKALKQINLKDYDAILVRGNKSKEVRPTVYDFLAHRAVDFFMNDESGLTQPANTFEIDRADYFSDAKTLGKMNLESQDSLSQKFYAFKILQDLISFHLNDKDPEAFIDVNLKRLKFVKDNAIIPGADSLYLSSLVTFEQKLNDDPASTHVSYAIAQHLNQMGQQYNSAVSEDHRWDIKNAVEKCKEAIKRFPESMGAKNCEGLLYDIGRTSLDLTTENVVVPDQPILALLKYKNLDNIYFRIARLDYKESRQLEKENRNSNEMLKKYLEFPVFHEWTQKVKNDKDYQSHSAEIKIAQLTSGYYLILASESADFDLDSSLIIHTNIWSSTISFIQKQTEQQSYHFYTLNRETGQPLKGVEVALFYETYDYRTREYNRKAGGTFISDKNGFFEVPALEKSGPSNSFYLEMFWNQEELITSDRFYHSFYSPRSPSKTIRTWFFTDRAIYRPGQTIYFKGIVMDVQGDKMDIKSGHNSTVEFLDANYQKIADVNVTTSEYGSFSGSFIAPQGLLNGRMTIRSSSGSQQIRVEEYKRPTFEITFEPIEGSYKINETVTLSGKAKAFAGNVLPGSQVKYRVVREVRFPWYDFYRGYWPFDNSSMEITNGVTQTDDQGMFSIDFAAIPDYTIPRKYKPVFNYMVYTDVTDVTGETQTAQTSVSVGYEALQIQFDVDKEVNANEPLQIKFRTKNLNGQPVPTNVNVLFGQLEESKRLIRKRYWPLPDDQVIAEEDFIKNFPHDQWKKDDLMGNLKIEKELLKMSFNTQTDSIIPSNLLPVLAPGRYVLKAEGLDEFGEKVEHTQYFTIYDPNADAPPVYELFWFKPLKTNCEPGENASFLIASADENVRVLYEVSREHNLLLSQWIDLNNEQRKIEFPVTEDLRGGFSIKVIFVKNNRIVEEGIRINVPHTNKELDFEFITFRDKLQPGQKETWKIRIKGKKGEKVAAELLASMYDGSLDAFINHSWNFDLYRTYSGYISWNLRQTFTSQSGNSNHYFKTGRPGNVFRTYDQINWFGFDYYGGYPIRFKGEAFDGISLAAEALPGEGTKKMDNNAVAEFDQEAKLEPDSSIRKSAQSSTTGLEIRRDFRETAFFFPDLQTDDQGNVILSFEMPESLTKWKLMGLAHSKDLKYGRFSKEIVTQKELMIVPNPPRFFRAGDQMNLTAKVVNLSKNSLDGEAELRFVDPTTLKDITADILISESKKGFAIKQDGSVPLSWAISIPEKYSVIAYEIKAQAGNFTDGEAKPIPVLTNRKLVTESLPMPVKGSETKKFTFEKLKNSSKRGTLKNHRLTLEFSSNPAWYAVQALPYIMQQENESADAAFNRFYANSIASHLANSNPKIKNVFDTWRDYTPDALLSNLEKNQELKSLILNETPWVMDARNETEQKQRIALLFDLNKMGLEKNSALLKLQQLQSPGGGWPWYKGMSDNRYISQQIILGMAHLRAMDVFDVTNEAKTKQMLIRAIRFIDQEMKDDYDYIVEQYIDYKEKDHLNYTLIHYLLARSYFMNDVMISKNQEAAFAYFRDQAIKFWVDRDLYGKGVLALALNNLGVKSAPSQIMASVKEHALYSEEMGMYFRDNNYGYYWYEAPIETQSLMIEAFDEIMNDQKAVEQMKIWLLKQKQTQSWETPKAAAHAVYALLLRGSDWLASDKLAEIKIGKETIDPMKKDDTKVEAGTGYFKTSWSGGDIESAMGEITVTNENPTIAWGAVYWQYFEDLDQITAHETPLSLKKQLFVERNTSSGPVIDPVMEGSVLKIGDKIKVRIELRADRDMEFIHMKDMRAAAFEPVNVLSGYRYQGGLGYYESTLDASTNFFFDFLRKGTYVFEYPMVISQKGNFSNGITTIQCMYAPEFTSHSEGIRVKVE